ncbi:MAG: PadR family transcriptional regulator [Solirubrobacteraceae bacterium]
MALRHAVLAALMDGEASGYELAKRFDVSVANFWSATPQQLYRELEALERDGLVRGRVVEQQRRPNKRVFTLTAAGRAALQAFIARPTKPAAMRDELLVKLQAADGPGDLDAVRSAVLARLERAREKLALYERLHQRPIPDGDVRPGARVGPYLTLMGGRTYEQANVEWCTAVLDVLDQGERPKPVEAGVLPWPRRPSPSGG